MSFCVCLDRPRQVLLVHTARALINHVLIFPLTMKAIYSKLNFYFFSLFQKTCSHQSALKAKNMQVHSPVRLICKFNSPLQLCTKLEIDSPFMPLYFSSMRHNYNLLRDLSYTLTDTNTDNLPAAKTSWIIR